MIKYESKLECHSSTNKKEIFKFLKNYKNKDIIIHGESNITSYWGDDYMFEIENTENNFHRINEIITNDYIHTIYIK